MPEYSKIIKPETSYNNIDKPTTLLSYTIDTLPGGTIDNLGSIASTIDGLIGFSEMYIKITKPE